MGERLLAKKYTPKQLEEMNQAQFDTATSAEKQRLSKERIDRHTAEVRSDSRVSRSAL